MRDNSSQGKMCFIHFHSVNIKEIWTDLAHTNSQQGARINAIFRKVSWKYFNRNSYYHKNILKTSGLLWASKSCNVILEFYFKQ